jgi:hypothetical protein
MRGLVISVALLALPGCVAAQDTAAGPVARIQRQCSGLTCTFYGSGSERAVTFEWRLPNGSVFGTDSTAIRDFQRPGRSEIMLVVADAAGRRDSATMIVEVGGGGPQRARGGHAPGAVRPEPQPPPVQAPRDAAAAVAPPADPSVWLVEDFRAYRSVDELMASPRYLRQEDANPRGIQLGPDGMVYAWPAKPGNCRDFSIGRNLRFPETVPEVWVELEVRFSPTFRTIAGGCQGRSNPDYKFLFGLVPGNGRFALKLGTYGSEWSLETPDQGVFWQGQGSRAVWDGQFHTYRFHWMVSSRPGVADGEVAFWLDGRLIHRATRLVINRAGIQGLGLGRNMNQGPDVATDITWRIVRVRTQNPGW